VVDLDIPSFDAHTFARDYRNRPGPPVPIFAIAEHAPRGPPARGGPRGDPPPLLWAPSATPPPRPPGLQMLRCRSA
jgi:hypothetical protein